MTKRKAVLYIVLVTAMMALLSTWGVAAGSGVFTEFTGYEACTPVPGSLNITPRDGNLHYEETYNCVDTASIPEVSGVLQPTVKGIFDAATFSGPLTGSAHLTNAEGGWIETSTGSLRDGVASMRVHALGEGAYEGMQAWWDYTWPAGNMSNMTFTGRILDSHE